jgi:hypothetical protein
LARVFVDFDMIVEVDFLDIHILIVDDVDRVLSFLRGHFLVDVLLVCLGDYPLPLLDLQCVLAE